MLAFPSMLIPAAEKAGMKVPNLAETDDFSADEFPHFQVFCTMQLGRRLDPGEHWLNAEVIAKIPDDKIKTVTLKELIDLGFSS